MRFLLPCLFILCCYRADNHPQLIWHSVYFRSETTASAFCSIGPSPMQHKHQIVSYFNSLFFCANHCFPFRNWLLSNKCWGDRTGKHWESWKEPRTFAKIWFCEWLCSSCLIKLPSIFICWGCFQWCLFLTANQKNNMLLRTFCCCFPFEMIWQMNL